MKIIYDDGGDRTNDESTPVSHHDFEDVSSDSVRTPGARKPVKPVRRPAPTLRPSVRKPDATEIATGVASPAPQGQQPVYAPMPYIQGGAQPTMPVQGYVVQPYPFTPEQMAALSQQYPQGYQVYAAPGQAYEPRQGYVPEQGYVQPQYVQYQPQVNPQSQNTAQAKPAQTQADINSGMKVLYQSPDFDRPEREKDTVSPSYTESLQPGMADEDVDFSEETLPSAAQKSTAENKTKPRVSATGKSFSEDDVEMSIFELNSMAIKSEPIVKPVRQPIVKKQGLDEEEIEDYYEDESDEAEQTPETKKGLSVSEVIRRIVLAVSIIAIIVAAGMLVNEYRLSKENQKVMEEVSNLIIEEATTQTTVKEETTAKNTTKADKNTTEKPVETTAPPTPAQQWEQIKAEYSDVIFPANLQLKYARLYATNQDFAGYLSADGVGLNLPVVQTDNDEEYLEKNFYGNSTKYGCPFVTHLNNIVELDTNTVIFGHHMNDGTVFGALDEYKSIEGFKDAPVITFNTLYQDYQWKVIAAFITNAYEKDDNGYVFRYYFTSLSTEERYSAFLNELSQRSLYDTGVDVLPTDKILTLSTCSHEFEEARFVVVARLVRNGESSEVDVSLATENPNPRYPQAYYDAKGLDNPYAQASRWEVG